MAKRGHAQYAAAAGDDIFVVELGSGVENFHAREVVGVGDPSDDFAFFVTAGLTAGSHHDANSCLRRPAQLVPGERAIYACLEQVDEVVLKAR